MATTLQIGFEDSATGKGLTLEYALVENDFVRRWAMVLQKSLIRGRRIHNDGNFFGTQFDSEPELRGKIEESLRVINSHKRKWIDLLPYPDMSRQFLMKLHEDFERLEPCEEFQILTSPPEVRSALTNLNIYIHRYEGLTGARMSHIDILFHPVDRFHFKDEDYELFRTRREFGEIFLAYGVTGVPILNAFMTDHAQEPVPQYNFTSGMTLWMAADEDFHQHAELESWLLRKWGWLPGHPKQAIGYISLGNLNSSLTSDEIAARIGKNPKVTQLKLTPAPDMRDFSLVDPAPSNVESGNPETLAFRSPPGAAVAAALAPQSSLTPSFLPQLVIELESPDPQSPSSEMTLEFDLLDRPITRRWLAVMKSAVDKKRPVIDHGVFYGFDLAGRDSLLETVRRALGELRLHESHALPPGLEASVAAGDLADPIRKVESLIERMIAAEVSGTVLASAYDLLRSLQKLVAGGDLGAGHFNLDFAFNEKELLADDDYRLFSPDSVWGGLYLSYGQLGDPTLAAFRARSQEPFHPQGSITAGVTVNFHPDFHFAQTEEYNAWLAQNGKSANDPKLALGSVQLGTLSTSRYHAEVVENVRFHARVKSVSFREHSATLLEAERLKIAATQAITAPSLTKALTKAQPLGHVPPAKWPGSKEVFRHLELTPWLMLPFQFDHKACYQEAAALLDRFVVHRSYDQSSSEASGGKWKSLGIRALGGDSSKTQNHTEYGSGEPDYKLSEIAEFCPKTLEFLSRLTDLESCQRVRFMLLEPGASISTHSDAPDKDVAFAVNVALNMPEECEFWADLNPDGTKNPYTRRIPIRAGSAFIFNNARYHQLENRSSEPRIHLIFHGPIKFKDEELLQAARAQNGVPDEKSLINKLVGRYSRLGRPIGTKSELFADWITAGIDAQVIPDFVRVAVIREEGVAEDIADEAVHRITLASVFPARPPIIPGNEIDAWLNRCLQEGASHAVLVTAGTYAFALPTFLMETLRAIHFLDSQDAAVMGHIMNRPDRPDDLPFLHEQFVILDLNRWQRLGRTSLGVPYSGQETFFPGYKASAENIHDDYTPLWLLPESRPPRRGRSGFGTAILARSIEAGISVVNVPVRLRDTKRYTYPRTGRCPQYLTVKQEIAAFLKNEHEKIYVFNNECPSILEIPEFQPDILVSVAAGFKPFSILRQYWRNRTPEKIVFLDISRKALEHFKWLSSLNTYRSVAGFLTSALGLPSNDVGIQFAERHLDAVLNASFNSDFDELLRYLRLIREATFVNADFISDPEHVVSALAPGKSAIFWHSNAWSSNMSMYRGSREDLDENYRKLGRAISTAHGMPGWTRNGTQEMLFGPSALAPTVIVTAGGDPGCLVPELYQKLEKANPTRSHISSENASQPSVEI